MNLLRSLFSDLCPLPSGFGVAGMRKHRICGALTLIGSGISALQRGVELAETSIGVISFEIRYFSRVREFHESNTGERDGMVISTVASREITIEGEITASTGGRMSDTFIAAITTIANDIAEFGSPTGGIYLQEVTMTQSRADWRKGRWRYESDPGLA